MKDNINYVFNKNNFDVVPIWSNSDFFDKIPKSDNLFLKKNKFKTDFIVGYSGNLGLTHPIEIIIEIAKYLQNEKDIMFLIAGEGEKKYSLIQKLNETKLKNIKILGFQPTELYPHLLSALDVGVVTLETNYKNLSVPFENF